MTPDQPENPQTKEAGRGVELFFDNGQDEQMAEVGGQAIDAAPETTSEAVDAVAASAEAAKDVVDEAIDPVEETADDIAQGAGFDDQHPSGSVQAFGQAHHTGLRVAFWRLRRERICRRSFVADHRSSIRQYGL